MFPIEECKDEIENLVFIVPIPWKMLMNKAHCNFKISQFPWNIQSWPKLGCFARKWLEKSQWKSKYSLLQCNKFSQSPLRCLIDKRENFKSSSVKPPWRQCCPHFIPWPVEDYHVTHQEKNLSKVQYWVSKLDNLIKTVSNGNHANFSEFFPHTFLSINRNQPVDKMSIFLDDPNYRRNFYLGEERENTILYKNILIPKLQHIYL